MSSPVHELTVHAWPTVCKAQAVGQRDVRVVPPRSPLTHTSARCAQPRVMAGELGWDGDNLQRQLDEIEAMEAILGSAPEWHTSAPALASIRAAAAAAAAGGTKQELEVPESGHDECVDVAFVAKVAGGDAELRLRFVLPAGYPSVSPPEVTAGCWQLSKAGQADLAAAVPRIVSAAMADAPGEEILLTVVQEVTENLEHLLAQHDAASDAASTSASTNDNSAACAEWRRCIFWVRGPSLPCKQPLVCNHRAPACTPIRLL